jgi:hypothetical protein
MNGELGRNPFCQGPIESVEYDATITRTIAQAHILLQHPDFQHGLAHK